LDSRWLRWKCLVCGYVYEGVMRLKECPKCGNKDPDKFEDAD
jgi:rubrerythrin